MLWHPIKKYKRTTFDNIAADQLVTDVVRHGRNHTQAHGAAAGSFSENGRQAIKSYMATK